MKSHSSFCLTTALCIFVFAFTACGGGGGGGEGGSNTSVTGGGGSGNVGSTSVDNSWLSFKVSPGQVTSYGGISTPFAITAASTRSINETLSVAVVDTQGVMSPKISVTPNVKLSADGAQPYVATLKSSPGLPPGTYDTQLEVRLCRDAPTICANPYPGSPWKVGLRVVVKPDTNLTSLSPLSGAPEWNNENGNAQQTGFVAADIQAVNFSQRWVKPYSTTGVATEGGKVVFSSVDQTLFEQWSLFALSENDGTELWRHKFNWNNRFVGPDIDWVSPPATSKGRAFVATQPAALVAFDINEGKQLTKIDLSAQFPRYRAPVLFGDTIYAPTGYYENWLNRFNAADLSSVWGVKTDWLPGADSSPPVAAVDKNNVYKTEYNKLLILSPSTGEKLWEWMAQSSDGTFFQATPIIGNDGKVFLSGDKNIVMIDAVKRNFGWREKSGWSTSSPVLMDSAVLIADDGKILLDSGVRTLNGGKVSARDPATGLLLWQWLYPSILANFASEDSYPGITKKADIFLIGVGRYAFVGMNGSTYAIDTKNQSTVWSYPASGPMAVSPQGVLYIADNQGTPKKLIAINLR